MRTVQWWRVLGVRRVRAWSVVACWVAIVAGGLGGRGEGLCWLTTLFVVGCARRGRAWWGRGVALLAHDTFLFGFLLQRAPWLGSSSFRSAPLA